ncbi:hypothetical protein WDW86_01640 [Bdellovibrionota bacterium FG-2]
MSLVWGALLLQAGCVSSSTPGISGAERKRNEHSIHKLVAQNLSVRRPGVRGAFPKALKGEVGYTSDTLPNAKLDCVTLKELFKDIKRDEAQKCLASLFVTASPSPSPLPSPEVSETDEMPAKPLEYTLYYLLERSFEPALVLEDDEGGPDCVKKTLGRIPVPREIFFQSTEEGKLQCYSARLNVEANQMAEVRLPMAKMKMKILLPLRPMPATDEEWLMQLAAWVLTPFFDPTKKTLRSVIVPEKFCMICLGERNLVKPTDPPPVLWP